MNEHMKMQHKFVGDMSITQAGNAKLVEETVKSVVLKDGLFVGRQR